MKIVGDRLFLEIIEDASEKKTKHGFIIPGRKNTDFGVGKVIHVGDGEHVSKLFKTNTVVEYECTDSIIEYDDNHVVIPHSCIFAIRT